MININASSKVTKFRQACITCSLQATARGFSPMHVENILT